MEAAGALESAIEQVSLNGAQVGVQAAEEAQLVGELQAGSEEAFAYVLERYRNPIYSLVAQILVSEADAADVLQNVFVKVFRGIGQFHGQSTLKTWLYRIAVREALNFRRGWFRRHFHEPFSIDDEPSADRAIDMTRRSAASGPYETLEQSERQELVRAALNALPRPYRAVLVLREMEELPYEEIAQLLDLPEGTVKSRLMRGRELLRRKLAGILGR